MVMHANRGAFLVATGASLVAAQLPRPSIAQTVGTVTNLKLGATTSDDMTPIVYAQKSGIFAKHGLDVELNPMTSGAASAAGLLAGTFDFGKSSTTSLLDAHE